MLNEEKHQMLNDFHYFSFRPREILLRAFEGLPD